MDINWLGHASFKIKAKTATAVTDPYDGEMIGLKFPKVEADILTVSHEHGDHNQHHLVAGDPFIARGPGEYEIKGVAFTGTPSFHDNAKGAERGKNTIFTFHTEGLSVCHLGDLGQDQLTDEQIEEIGQVDILMVPVGGIFTIDASRAAKIAAQLEPKVIIPMHYQTKDLKIEISGRSVTLAPVESFLKEMGKEEVKPEAKYSISSDKLPDEPQVVILEKS